MRYLSRSASILAVALATGALGAAETSGSALPGALLPDGLGVNIHFTDPKAGEMEELAAGGFTWVRMDFGWGGIERQAGVYDFSAYDRLLAALAAQHVRACFILDYGNPLYDGGLSPHTDAGRAAFCRWVKAALERYRGRGIVWEMWNEPNGDFWKPKADVDEYIALARAVGATVRATAPAETFVGPATSEIDMRYLEACFKGGMLEFWDAVSVHPYRQHDPEGAAREYRALRELIVRYAPAGKQLPILSGEWGYSSAWGSTDEARQGRVLPREWLTNIANEVPLSIWYDWHEDGTDPKDSEAHFGTVRNAYRAGQAEVYERKPAYLAARTLTMQLRGHHFCRRLALESADDYALLFAKDDHVVLAAWTIARDAHTITIPASAGAFDVVDHLGAARPAIEAGASGLAVPVGGDPLYLTAAKPNDLLRVAAACSRLPLELRVHAPAALPIPLTLINPLARELSVTVAVDGDHGAPMALTAGATVQPHTTRQVVARADEPLHVTWTIAGLGSFAEDSRIVVTDPLEVEVLPALQRGAVAELPVRVRNAGGDAFTGSIALTDGEGLRSSGSAQVAFTAGQTEQIITLSLAAPAADSYRAGVVVHQGEATALSLAPQRFHVMDAFGHYDAANLASAYAVLPDGDPKVGSRLTLAPAAAADLDPLAGPAFALDYHLDKGWKFLRVVAKNDAVNTLPGKPTAIGMWLRSDGSGNHTLIRVVDSTGQTFQPGGQRLLWSGWRFVRFAFDAPGGHWGGANDGIIHYPVRLDTLLLIDHDQAHETQGTVLFAAPTLIE